MSIVETLNTIKATLGIPSAYSHFKSEQVPPYLVYIGAGQNQMSGDDTAYWRRNTYQLELYFAEKDEALETSIEDALLADGWRYSRSDDAYEESQGLFVIFYDVN